MERHLPYKITQLTPDTDERTPLNPSQTWPYSICLPRKDGRLSWPWCWFYTEMVYQSADSHPSRQ